MQKIFVTNQETEAHDLACLFMEQGIKYSLEKRHGYFNLSIPDSLVQDAKEIIGTHRQERTKDISN